MIRSILRLIGTAFLCAVFLFTFALAYNADRKQTFTAGYYYGASDCKQPTTLPDGVTEGVSFENLTLRHRDGTE